MVKPSDAMCVPNLSNPTLTRKKKETVSLRGYPFSSSHCQVYLLRFAIRSECVKVVFNYNKMSIPLTFDQVNLLRKVSVLLAKKKVRMFKYIKETSLNDT